MTRRAPDRPAPRAGRGERRRAIATFTAGIVAAAALVKLAGSVRGDAAGTKERVKEIERRWANPLMLRLADVAPLPVARLEHRGRRSGRLYATPVWAAPVAGGFIVTLPYGRDADWATNLLAAGDGVLQFQGVRYRIGQPRIMPAAALLVNMPLAMQLATRLLGTRDAMRVDVEPGLTAEIPPPA